MIHGAMKVTEDLVVLSCDGELLPEVFAKELAFGAEQFFGTAIEERDVPVAIDAGDGVCGGLEDLAELSDGGVAKELCAFTIGDVVVEEGDAFIARIDRDIEPTVDAFGVVLDAGLLGGAHDAAIDLLEVGADEMWIDLPKRSMANIGWGDPAAMARLLVRKGDDPVAIDADDPFGDLTEQAGEALMEQIFIAPAMAGRGC